MAFISYDDSTKPHFDGPTQKLLDQLQAQFGKVEIKELGDNDGFCARIWVEQPDGPLPFAGLGKTAVDAAARLIAVTQLIK